MNRLFALILLLSATTAHADQSYLVLGSFSSRETASNEGERISGVAGVEVMMYEVTLAGAVQYRLLTELLSDNTDQDELRYQLDRAGVKDPWTLRLSGDLPFMETLFADNLDGDNAVSDFADMSIDDGYSFSGSDEYSDAELMALDSSLEQYDSQYDQLDDELSLDVDLVNLAGNFVVAGSFQSREKAESFSSGLDAGEFEVIVQSAVINETSYQRVLIGPVLESKEQTLIAELVVQGITGAWVLRNTGVAVVAPVPVQKSMPRTPIRQLTQPASKSAVAQSKSAVDTTVKTRTGREQSDFNFATLKKKSTFGLIPAKKTNPVRWRTDIATEFRQFNDPGLNDLEKFHASLSFQAEYYKTWNGGDDIFAFVPFARWDAEDDERSHVDIRELTWVHVEDNWELRVGIRKVFWGVTEAQHLVDIINQTDNLENTDGEEKLGQPMINLSFIKDWGILDFYVLTGFREREFPGEQGRPRLPFLVDSDAAIYESSAAEYRTDVAVRWSHYFGELEVGLSHFSGTSREPRFQVQLVSDPMGIPRDVLLIPVYDVIDQTGLDAQYFVGDWAWKLEAISRSGQGDRYNAATFGFEKTFVGVFGSRSDLGIVAEYLYDNRDELAPVIGEDDVALGFRWTVNNPADATALLVWLYDLDSDEYLMSLEASSRVGSKWKVVLEASIFHSDEEISNNFSAILNAFGNPDSELGLFQDEDFLKLELIRYF